MQDRPHALADRYLRFAREEAQGISALYETFAVSVAEDPDLLALISALPKLKQQPNLLLAATRHVAGFPEPGQRFSRHVLAHWARIEPVVLARATQTNEPARCACILPVLVQIDGPIALIEVGALAGLCLLPDRYGYDYGHAFLPPPVPDAPVFACTANHTTPLPQAHPEIAWRGGLDLNPLDVHSAEDMAWLTTLVWPEQKARRARLEAAIATARDAPPLVRQGDLIADTQALVEKAPAGTVVVVFHSAVLTYVPPSVRREFATMTQDLGVIWIANEGASILSDAIGADTANLRAGSFHLSRDGCVIARTGPHGQFIDWIDPG